MLVFMALSCACCADVLLRNSSLTQYSVCVCVRAGGIIGMLDARWPGSRVVSMLDSGAEGPGFKWQP